MVGAAGLPAAMPRWLAMLADFRSPSRTANTKGSKVMDFRIAIFAASSRGARPPSGAPPRALAGRLKKPACGYSNLSMSVAGRNRRHPRRARSPRPDATAPLSKSPKSIGFWYNCIQTHSVSSSSRRQKSLPMGRLFGRGGGIRTHGLLVPNEARYQAAPRPDN